MISSRSKNFLIFSNHKKNGLTIAFDNNRKIKLFLSRK